MKLKHNHAIAGAFIYVLLGVFALMSTALVLLGIRVYAHASEVGEENNQKRLRTSYVRTMLRAAEGAGAVTAETLDGLSVLTIRESYEEEEYLTRIYCYEGQLYEQYAEAALPFSPENGESICAAEGFTVRLEQGYIYIEITAPGGGTERILTAVCGS